jgi:hypothetical protein
LRDVFAENQLGFHLLVDARFLKCCDCGAPVRGVLRVSDGNFLHALIQQRLPSKAGYVDPCIRRRPDRDAPDRIFVEGSRLGEARGFQFSGIVDVSREEQIEGRSVLQLREKISARAVGYVYFRSGLFLELSRDILHGEFQISGSGHTDFLCARGTGHGQRHCNSHQKSPTP